MLLLRRARALAAVAGSLNSAGLRPASAPSAAVRRGPVTFRGLDAARSWRSGGGSSSSNSAIPVPGLTRCVRCQSVSSSVRSDNISDGMSIDVSGDISDSGGGSSSPYADKQRRLAAFRLIFDELAQGSLISQTDLARGLKIAVPHAKITDEQVDRMFRIGDLDGSGCIDLQEFMTLFEDIPEEDISLTSLAEYWLGFSDGCSSPGLIFQRAWRQLAAMKGGEERIRLPQEILFLGGAPGAGKGTMTPYVMRERGITAEPIVLSSLLNSPTAKKIIDQGGLVSDTEVFSMLLEELARDVHWDGCLVDGFPRTTVQVELLQLLQVKMKELSASLTDAPTVLATDGPIMPRPRFRMCILYVDEHESIQRQLSRGRKAMEHNRRVEESGEGVLEEVRETDLSVKAAKQRYKFFMEGTMGANDALKSKFPYNLINASGTVEEVKQVVMQELSYQSSLELAEETYNAICHIPTASQITRHARQHLVARLDTYQREHTATFNEVVRVIDTAFLPSLRRHALVGEARVTVQGESVFTQPLAMDMAVDIMFDRGFALRVEERTGAANEFRFKITFEPPRVNNVAADAL